ncbi:MAG: phosphate ABC transporter substrate-binding protein PstS [Deltaproteobacteria bacterium]|nr:phosphate ABC transporter substrate-binding protein PstS [Deltaproteobacteria bacterium]
MASRGFLQAAVAAVFFFGIPFSGAMADTVVTGAGATFPYPVYAKWAAQYHEVTGVRLNYQSIGSGGGIRQIKARTVDFGASDKPLEKQELDRLGLVQWPMVMGGVVVVVNLPGIARGEIRLTPSLLADIFAGRIARWNDPAIRAINHSPNLPDLPITVVHRADGSGTTWIFTGYLSRVSPKWKSTVGWAKAVRWPTGIGGKGNEGVSAYVGRVRGAIGYVEFAYALQNKMTYVLLRNREGAFVAPSIRSFQAAASNADWSHAPGFYMVLVDQVGTASWPITGASFILMYKDQPDASKAVVLLKFFDWCYRHGKDAAVALSYVPMPQNVVGLVEQAWRAGITSHGQPIWPARP